MSRSTRVVLAVGLLAAVAAVGFLNWRQPPHGSIHTNAQGVWVVSPQEFAEAKRDLDKVAVGLTPREIGKAAGGKYTPLSQYAIITDSTIEFHENVLQGPRRIILQFGSDGKLVRKELRDPGALKE